MGLGSIKHQLKTNNMVASDAKYSKWQPSFWIRAAKAGKTWRQKAQKTTTRFLKLKSMISTMQNYCKFSKNGWHNFFLDACTKNKDIICFVILLAP